MPYQLRARGLSRLGGAHHSRFIISADRIAGAACGKLPRGFALPFRTLTPHLADLGAAMSLMQRAERGAGLDRLQLLWIADQHDLGAGIRCVR